jgi:hypothetical protein
MSPPRAEFDLAIRSRIGIDAPADAVWAHLSRLQAWKSSVVSLERLSGQPDAEGETLRVGQRPGDVTVNMIMRTVRVQRPGWKIQTLQTEDGDATNGYVVYTLDAEGEGTRLSCDVVARCRVPLPPGVTDVAAFAQQANASTLAKLDADHAALKALVESGRPC